MMFALLAVLSSCGTFVPYVQHETLLMFNVNISGLLSLVEQVPRVVAFVHDRAIPQSRNARENLMSAIPLFGEDIVFVEISVNNASSIVEGLGISAPHLLLYANSTLWEHCRFPYSEAALLNMLNIFAHGQCAPVATRADLYRSLGKSYFTLLYPASDVVRATNIQRFVAAEAGFIDMIPFARQSAAEMGLKPDSYYLFRLEDVSLVEIEPTETSLIKNLSPSFKRLSPNDFISKRGMMFGISVTQLTTNVVDIFEAVSENFPDWTVGFVDRVLLDFVNVSAGGTMEKTPSIAVLNVSERTYFPIPSELNSLLRSNSRDAVKEVINFLKNLPAPVVASESIPLSQEQNYTVLVGKTFDNFVSKENTDALVLFVSHDTLQTKKYMRVFNHVAGELAAAGIASVQFGVINATANSANFPLMPVMPHIELYPAKNKSDHRTFYGQADINDILRFIDHYAVTKLTGMDIPEATQKDLTLELMQIYVSSRSMTPAERAKADERLSELAPLLNIDLEKINDALKDDISPNTEL